MIQSCATSGSFWKVPSISKLSVSDSGLGRDVQKLLFNSKGRGETCSSCWLQERLSQMAEIQHHASRKKPRLFFYLFTYVFGDFDGIIFFFFFQVLWKLANKEIRYFMKENKSSVNFFLPPLLTSCPPPPFFSVLSYFFFLLPLRFI